MWPSIAQGNGRASGLLRCHTAHKTRKQSVKCASRHDGRLANPVLDGARCCCSIAAALVLTLSGRACAEDITYKFKASADPEIRAAQTALVEAYAYVNFYYLDDTFNGVDWQAAFRGALERTYAAQDATQVVNITQDLLAQLGDPYTRILTNQAAQVFNAETTGQVLTYGLGVKPESAGCQVEFVADGSAAANAGIAVGDVVVAYNDRQLDNADIQRAFKRALESRDQKELQLRLLRGNAKDDAKDENYEAVLSLAPVEVESVQYGVVRDNNTQPIGYARLVVFSDTTPDSLYAALEDIAAENVTGLVVDLRGNPGGIVAAGIDVARLLLKDGSPFITVYGRGGYEEAVAIEGSVVMSRPFLAQLSRVPMVVLVNHDTASTSEMLASSLSRNRGATLIGESTLGKGRTQTIFKVSEGSLLLVSTISYVGAAAEQLNGVGLQPSERCAPEQVSTEYYKAGSLDDSASLRDDPCIDLAVRYLSKRRGES